MTFKRHSSLISQKYNNLQETKYPISLFMDKLNTSLSRLLVIC